MDKDSRWAGSRPEPVLRFINPLSEVSRCPKSLTSDY